MKRLPGSPLQAVSGFAAALETFWIRQKSTPFQPGPSAGIWTQLKVISSLGNPGKAEHQWSNSGGLVLSRFVAILI